MKTPPQEETVPFSCSVVLPDMHLKVKNGTVDGLDLRTFRAVYQYLLDSAGPQQNVVQLGDYLDLNCISRWTKGKPFDVYGESLGRDYDLGKYYLDLLQKVGLTNIVEGNHDARPEALIREMPQLRGQVEFPKMLELRERGIKFTPYWTKGAVLKLGKLGIIHGYYTNKYHAEKHLSAYQMNLLYGHCHGRQYFSKPIYGEHTSQAAECIGTLSLPSPDYIAGKPTDWQQAFAIVKHLPAGKFQTTTIGIQNHRFYVDGILYDGNKISNDDLQPKWLKGRK